MIHKEEELMKLCKLEVCNNSLGYYQKISRQNSQLSLYSECKIPCVFYAAIWVPNKVPEQEIASSRVY